MCEACPDGASCDGSDQVSCQPGFYKFHPTDSRPVCHQCPTGGDCRTGSFAPVPADSKWERGGDGKFRVQQCPSGFALTREGGDLNPLGDACAPCPPGTYNLDGSVWNAQNQSGVRPPPDGFCQSCPRAGASCPGGSTVYAMEGWYTFEIEMRSARRTNSTKTTIETYECPLEACAGNNTCKGGRTGLLCGYCPAGTALELNVCVECERDGAAISILQIVVGILALWCAFPGSLPRGMETRVPRK